MELYFQNFLLEGRELFFYSIICVVIILIIAHFIIGFKDSKNK